MANEKIIDMSTLTNINDYANSLKRMSKFPLDYYSIFNSLADAQTYAAGDKSYAGHVIAVTVAGSDPVVYVVDNNGSLVEVGKKTQGDSNSIDLNSTTGTLSIHGFDDAANQNVPYKDTATGKIVWGPVSGLIPGAVVPTTDGETIAVAQDPNDNTKYIISIKGKTTASAGAVLRKQSDGTYTWDVIYSKSEVDDLLDDKVDKTTTIAGVDLQDNITASELKTALDVTKVTVPTEKAGTITIDGVTKQIVADNTVTDANYHHVDVSATDGVTANGVTYKYDDTTVKGLITAEETRATGVEAGLRTDVDAKIPLTQKGAASGVATLDENTKIPMAQIPDAILGNMTLGGTVTYASSTMTATFSNNGKTILKRKTGKTINATATLLNQQDDVYASGALTSLGYKNAEGLYFIADNSFDLTVESVTYHFEVGDWLISIGTGWRKIDNTDAVTGVKGNAESTYRTGNVNITATNIGVAEGATKVEASNTNGNIKINGTETTVYTEVANTVHDADYKHITVTGTSVSDGTNTFTKYDDTALASRVTTAESDIDALESGKQKNLTEGTGISLTTGTTTDTIAVDTTVIQAKVSAGNGISATSLTSNTIALDLSSIIISGGKANWSA